MTITKLTPYRIRQWPLDHVKVFVDSREQQPWDLSPMRTETTTLATGDYSSACGRYLLERKNGIDELISCMTSGRERFERELERMQAFESAIVLVESAYDELATGQYRSRMNRDSALATLVAWQQRYQIPFQFCGSRTEAERFAQSYFHQQLRNHLTALLNVQRTLASNGLELIFRWSNEDAITVGIPPVSGTTDS